jgi:hypothetical protein
MIWQSYYWKKELLKIADKLDKRINQKKWFEASNANAEKDIMISAFMIRRLYESNKIDKEMFNKTIKICQYKSNGKKINLLKRLSPDNYFDMNKPIFSNLTIKDICNNIIHSYIFILIFNDKGFNSFWVASDYNKFKFMLEIEMKIYLPILMKVGNFYPKSEIYEYDEKLEDYKIVYNPKKLLHYIHIPSSDINNKVKRK